ncbi:hypothetical protein IQ247_18345 [Plectonema cf. radiosum LEGE 06105]|uniref:Uncharacterized protein n=1 Tax=Plectonema cf. radiosum LEGE 06105 TaxID=945769 RepID=A0A8J7F421_9CYAN|nr:hypothetical protein [Plectonema radiosum]MBE9214605.1 hypothetical protein [Plectonema cf. radiosum LEGE 06105]
MINTLICTVGTSLFANFKYSQEEELKQAFTEKNWQKLTLLLLDKPNTERICGAEINSIARIYEKGFLSSLEKLVFGKKEINLRDDHGKDKLQNFAEKICNSPYVKKVVNSLPFNPKATNQIRRTKANGIVEFVLTWTDAGLRLCIETTGRNLAETNTIALHLQENYSK